MLEITGNLWDQDGWYIITANGTIKKNKEAVMGKGITKEAKEKYPNLPFELGQKLLQFGNHVFCFSKYKIITFPVKTNWWENADLKLIELSCCELRLLICFGYENDKDFEETDKFFLVRPGCGNGGLEWNKVKPLIEPYFLDDRFIIVNR